MNDLLQMLLRMLPTIVFIVVLRSLSEQPATPTPRPRPTPRDARPFHLPPRRRVRLNVIGQALHRRLASARPRKSGLPSSCLPRNGSAIISPNARVRRRIMSGTTTDGSPQTRVQGPTTRSIRPVTTPAGGGVGDLFSPTCGRIFARPY